LLNSGLNKQVFHLKSDLYLESVPLPNIAHLLLCLTSFWISISFYICSFLILKLNNFKNGGFAMSTNFLARVIRKTFTFILISTLLTFLIVTIQASDALSLDTTFGGDGKETVSFSTGNDVGSGIAVQSDDKIVVVGTSDNGSGTSELALARFNVDGSLDPTFSGDGKVSVSFSAGNDVGSGIAVQSDDKIVVVGTSDDGSGTSEFAVARYLLDLTSTAGGDGGGGGGGSGGGCLISAAAYGFRMQKESLSLVLLFGFLLIGFLEFGKKLKK
jgi:uncharacterized delta-60 repeat protein